MWQTINHLTSVSGGECVGAAIAAAGTGSLVSSGSIQVSQTGGSLTATATDSKTGATTSYTGTVGVSSFTLNFTSCNPCTVPFQCPNGALRDVGVQTDTINGNVIASGQTATGTEASTYNVLIAGTTTPVGLMTLTSAITATKTQ